MTDAGNSTPSHSLPVLEPGSVFAGYQIEGILDRGGMGVIYQAADPEAGRSVALKLVAPEHTQNPADVARFMAEAHLAASLEHPNIVPIYRAGEHDGVLYLAMRLMPGTTLRHLLDGGQLELTRVARIVSEVGDALDAVHAAGLVHRDIEPGNILVTDDGEHEHAHLTDFGLTKRFGSAGNLTQGGGWAGTPDYVAPEQIQGQPVDGRADVYSLGCVIYEMLTAHVAYPKDGHMAKLWAHVTDPPPRPRRLRPDLVEAFDTVVERATAKDPADRYATAGELATALRDAVGQQDAKRQYQAAQATALPDEPPDDDRDSTHDETVADNPPQVVAATATTDGGTTGDDATTEPHPGRRLPLVAILVFVALLAAASIVAVIGDGGSPSRRATATATPSGLHVDGELAPVPTNKVNGVGSVVMRLDADVAHVRVTTTGLLNGFSHAMHIHAQGRGLCPPGSAARLHNGALSITTKDGAPYYGHVFASLTTTGDTSARSYLAFARFPSTGSIRYTRTIDVGPVVAAAIRQNSSAVVVIHGIDYNHNDTYDFSSLDRSDLKRSLPAEQTAPALCGALIAQQPKRGSNTASAPRIYAATLVPAPGEQPSSFLCDLRSVAASLL